MHQQKFFTQIFGSILTTRIGHADSGSVLFTLDISQETHFFMQGNNLIIRQNNQQDTVILNDTVSPDAAQHLLNTLTDALIQHQKTKLWRRRIIWSLIFITLVAVFGHRLLPTTSPIQTALLNSSDPQPAPLPIIQSVIKPAPLSHQEQYSEQAPMIQPTPTVLATLANNLRDAAGRKIFTIPLTTGHPRTLYVFSDPLCQHCRDIEPTLEVIGKNYNIEIFPVTLVGKQQSATQVIPVLCALPENRRALWQSLFDGNHVTPASICEIGEKALAVNDKALAAYGFPGTPQIIADDGRPVPFSALENDETLAAFMNVSNTQDK